MPTINHYILPGIKAIAYCKCDNLIPSIPYRAICGMPVPVFAELENVQFFGVATCELVTEKINGDYLDSVTLKFLTNDVLPLDIDIAFVVTDVNGKSYLIGSKESPFTKIKITWQFGDPGNERNAKEYTVTHSSLKSLVKCIIAAPYL